MYETTCAVYNTARTSKDDRVLRPIDFIPERQPGDGVTAIQETDEEFSMRKAMMLRDELLCWTAAEARNS